MNGENIVDKLSLIEKEIFNPIGDLYLDNLLDLASAISYDIHGSGTMKDSKPIKAFLDRFSNFSDKIYPMRVSQNDFSVIQTVGQGGFGRVDLVRHKQTNNIYAMKIMDKSTFVKNSFNGFWEERDIMAKNSSDWLIKCFHTFMDMKKLYIVMEYMPGGDLYHWMTELEDFSDEQTHFYAMEIVLAIEVLHKMGFIHRDLKPENMLLDRNGHMKLTDFGTCIRTTNGKVKTNHLVGTPDYISPEVLSNIDFDIEVGYEIDWWAFGIVIYELFYGETPFEGESLVDLYRNIMRYKKTLGYPKRKPLRPKFIDFLSKILTNPLERMDITQVKAHPYLTKSEYKWNFHNIRNCQSPIIIKVDGEDDTKYINYDPNVEQNNISNSLNNKNFFSGENLAFTGFTFNRYGTYNALNYLDILEIDNAHHSQNIVNLNSDLEEKEARMMEMEETNMFLFNELEETQKNSRKKKGYVNHDSARKIKQLEADLIKEREQFQEKVKECNEIRNDCQDWQDKNRDLKALIDNQNNTIKGLSADLNNRGIRNVLPQNFELKTLEGKLEMLKKSNGRHKIYWIPYFGNLKPFKLDIYQNETDNTPLISIDLRSVLNIREPSAAECVHVDKALLPQIIQIVYEKKDYVDASLMVDDANPSIRSSYIGDSGPNGIYTIENHSFVPMQFRSYATCDLCHQSCGELLNPPLALECANCKKRIHFDHIQTNEYKIQWCQGAIEVAFFKVESKEARKAWINCLNELKDYQKSHEVQIAPNTYYRYVRVPGRHSSAV